MWKRIGTLSVFVVLVFQGYGNDYYFLGPFRGGEQKTLDITAVGAGELTF